ncbi:MAG: hypothetical protein IAE80_29195 [Anaerolinea sp.]|nr:hypothetical protein [Anaerolinea sp.]
MRLTLVFILLLVLTAPASTAANAQIAVIDSGTAPLVVELAAWDVPGVTGLAWAGSRLAAATTGGVLLYDTDDWTEAPVVINPADAALDVILDANTFTLVYATTDTVVVLDLLTRREVNRLSGSAPIAFSPDGSTLAYSSGADSVVLWAMTAAAPRAVLVGHSDQITDVVFSPDGGSVATTSVDMTLRRWDAVSGEQTGFSRSRRHPLLCVEFSPGGWLLASGAEAGIVRLNNLAVDTERVLSRALRDNVTGIHFTPSGSLMLFTAGSSIFLWTTDASAATSVLVGHGGTVSAAVFNPSGTLIASAGTDETIRLWGVPE